MKDYKTLPDAELVSLLKANEAAAFTEIWNRYYTLLFSFTLRRLNDKEESKDLIYDAFADIWEKRLTVNIPGELIAFLFTVIKNRILDYYKHKKIVQRYTEHFQEYLNQVQDNTDHLVRYNDLSALIEREIAALPENMRIVLELSRRQGLSRKEISDLLDMPENSVKTNLHRALKILKTKLGLVIYLTYFSHLAAEIKEEPQTMITLNSGPDIGLCKKYDPIHPS
ncbi:RNA polymerase sigma-70 factor (family 1) [Pedobacter africanus]|uniref:RNA polymerase sigma-70 factor (Family 1) n=1 Tax=Pedobacter africanus TaxID=151894 RepID=A0ACC6KT75_9SPHI|nr:RNA polymerase sigma-70 factor [Pedobacter africanus]MDR6782328.1 RNA polymerase sigma-70 factor (family 1) [Pedobacter africanus]